jgi:hypothetical protein
MIVIDCLLCMAQLLCTHPLIRSPLLVFVPAGKIFDAIFPSEL